MASDSNHTIDELIELINKGNAHVSLEDALADLAPGLRGKVPENLPYSIWQLVEHMRIAQKDIVDFCESADYEKLDWPADYWPEHQESVSDKTWHASVEAIEADKARFFTLLKEKKNALFETFPWGSGQHLFREALLIADHNAYHVAEIVVIRRLLKAWH